MTTFARKSLLAINPAFEEGRSHTESNRRTTQHESRRSCDIDWKQWHVAGNGKERTG